MKKLAIAIVPWLFSFFGHKALAQDDKKMNDDKKESQEIIIRKKGDKDANIRIEITGDKVLVNGKPLVEFKDDEITVNKRKIIVRDADGMHMAEGFADLGDLGNMRNFSWSESDDEGGAFLGVVTEETKDGAKITSVTEGSGAAKAGLKEGDIITKLDDKKIDGPGSLYNAVNEKKPKDEVKVYYTRDGKDKTVKATLQERKNSARVYSFSGPDGNSKTFTLPRQVPGARNYDVIAPRAFNDNMYDFYDAFPRQKKLGLKVQDTEEGNGVKVLDVEANSASATAGLLKDDIVTEIGGVKVTNTDEVREQLMDNMEKKSYSIKALRNGKEMSFEIKIPKKLKTANL